MTVPSLRAGLMTSSGRLVSIAQDGTLVHRPFAKPGHLELEIPAALCGLGPHGFVRFLEDRQDAEYPAPACPLEGFTITPGAAQGTIAFRRDGRFLRAPPDQVALAHDRTQVLDDESFLPVTGADHRLLAGLLTNDWVLRSNLARVSGARIGFTHRFRLDLGGTHYDLRHLLPFEGRALPYRIPLFREGWRFDELCLYRPLVQIACFGPEEAAMLPDAIRALTMEGAYDGPVLVVGARDRETVLAGLPGMDARRILVRSVAADEPGGQALARLGTLDDKALLAFQPVLMLGPRVLASAPLAPLLAELACADRIAASLEPASRRRVSPYVGLSLLQRDGHDLRHMAGLDVQVLGVPNLATHAPTLNLVRRVVAGRARGLGNAPVPPWILQEALNYVAWAVTPFDTDILARHVAEATTPGHATLRHYATDPEARAALAARHAPERRTAQAEAPAFAPGSAGEGEDDLLEPPP